MTGWDRSSILRHTLGCPAGYRELALLTRPMHWAPQCARIVTKPLRRPQERSQSRELPKMFRNWFRVQASGSIGPIWFSWGYGLAAPPSSSAMSPAGYSFASLSSKRLRFADRFLSCDRSEFESTENPVSQHGSAALIHSDSLAGALVLTF